MVVAGFVQRRPAPVLLAILVFAAFVAGRLLMEPSGVGLALLAVAVPFLLVALMTLYGKVIGLVAVVVLLLVGLGARSYFAAGGPWVALLLLPVVAGSAYMTWRVVSTIWRTRGEQAAFTEGEREGPPGGDE